MGMMRVPLELLRNTVSKMLDPVFGSKYNLLLP